MSEEEMKRKDRSDRYKRERDDAREKLREVREAAVDQEIRQKEMSDQISKLTGLVEQLTRDSKGSRSRRASGVREESDESEDSGSESEEDSSSEEKSSKPKTRRKKRATVVPDIPSFYGETRDEMTIGEWIDQLEVVAKACQWNKSVKLANLICHLRGRALRYYHSCKTKQRNSYRRLSEALIERFTPVHVEAIQMGMFYRRDQRENESVDAYMEELQILFKKGFPKLVAQDEKEAEEQIAQRFIAGLRPELEERMIGLNGPMDGILAKARFEEARCRESKVNTRNRKTTDHLRYPETSYGERRKPTSYPFESRRCHNCGGVGHLKRDCRVTLRAEPKESKGSKIKKGRIDEADVKVLTSGCSTSIGPIVKEMVFIDGQPVEAQIDTGSSVSIVSLQCIMDLWSKGRDNGLAKDVRIELAEQRFRDPSVELKTYNGATIPMLAEVTVRLRHKEQVILADMLVENKAPQDLLLGTDCLCRLGKELTNVILRPKVPQQEDIQTNVNKITQQEDMQTEVPQQEDTQTNVNRITQQENTQTEVLQQEDAEIQQQEATQQLNKNIAEKQTDGYSEKSPELKMSRAVKIPARSTKVVPVEVCGNLEGSEQLLEPISGLDENISVEPGIVSVEDGKMIKVSVSNWSDCPITIEENKAIGVAQPVKIVEVSGEKTNCTPKKEKLEKERNQRLLHELELEETQLTPEQKDALIQLVSSFTDVFAFEDEEQGSTSIVKHEIDTEGSHPIKHYPRRIPHFMKSKVEELIADMLQKKVIRPSKSPWSSPIVLVAKKDGTIRFCVDYRKLNYVTRKDVFPLPRIDDCLDTLSGNKYFTTLDLRSGFWQVQMEEKSIAKTAFTTHAGLYEFKVMPFGLCNAPSTFQRLINNVLEGLIPSKCIGYIDDILVLGSSFEEHIQNLKTVFERLRVANLKLKPSKCRLAQSKVSYLGHTISAEGVSTELSKLAAVQEFPRPDCLKKLRSFLGLTSYYRRFIPNYSKTARALYDLTKKDVSFVWTGECETAFLTLKEVLTSAPTLVFPDFKSPFILETDASGVGLGAVLSQKGADGMIRPIAYASRTIQGSEKNYGITELEALAVVWATKHFRQYLYGYKSQIITDHQPLKSLLNTPHPSGKLARWGLALQELDTEIIYRPGRSNSAADALSRVPLPVKIVAAVPDSTVLREEQLKDPQLKQIIDYLEKDELPNDEKQSKRLVMERPCYEMENGELIRILAKGDKRIIPPESMREKLIQDCHNGKFGAHLGPKKVYSQILSNYWWPCCRMQVFKQVHSCNVCRSRYAGRTRIPPLQSIPVGGPFECVGVDVMQLPTSRRGNHYVVVFMDYLTKWPEVYPVRSQDTLTIAKLLVQEIVPRHGVPKNLLSDRGGSFLSNLIIEVYQLLGVKKINTTAYHPQTDGLIERFNRTLSDMLAKSVGDHPKDWDLKIPYVLFAYRTSVQESTRYSPFYLLYGRQPVLPTDEVLQPKEEDNYQFVSEFAEVMVENMQEAWKLARENISKAQSHQKNYYDQKTKPVSYRNGDLVRVFMPAKKTSNNRKLALPYEGPFKIVKVHETGVEVMDTRKSRSRVIRVAWNRIYPYQEPMMEDAPAIAECSENQSPWKGRLRRQTRTSVVEDEDM